MSDGEDLEARLARALNEEADVVTPSDRLDEVRAQVASGRGGRGGRRWWPVAAAAAAVVLVGGVGVATLGDRGEDRRTPAPAATSTPPAVTSPVPSPAPSGPSGSATPSGTGSPGPGGVTVPVYYLGRDGQRLALFREFHRSAAAGGAVVAALTEALDGSRVQDRDYAAPWLPGTASAAHVGRPSGGVVTVDLPAAEAQARGRTTEQARLAVRQLAWTASAAAQDAGLGVRVTIGGKPGRLFGSVAVGDVVRRPGPATAYEDLASIWVLDPTQGEVLRPGVGGVVVRGTACTFEANVVWQLLRDTAVVRSGYTTASSGCPMRGDWSVSLGRLAPGSYTFRAYEPPASGQGAAYEDTKSFTVR